MSSSRIVIGPLERAPTWLRRQGISRGSQAGDAEKTICGAGHPGHTLSLPADRTGPARSTGQVHKINHSPPCPLPIGSKAPDFTLKTTTAEGLKDVKLSDNFGKKQTLLLFFPLAFTGTCTQEMCDVTAGLGEYSGLNAEVYGISVDSPFAQAAWAKQNKISGHAPERPEQDGRRRLRGHLPGPRRDRRHERTGRLRDREGRGREVRRADRDAEGPPEFRSDQGSDREMTPAAAR